MGSLVLAGATSGSTTITPSATGTYTITLPAETGTIQTSGAGFTTNGVAYASSTSALATGSALTYDGSNFRVNSGTSWATSTGGVQLSMDGAGADAYLTTYYDTHTLTLGAGVSLKNLIKISGSGASNNINFRVNNSNAMVLNSTGLGIGETNPSTARLYVTSDGSALDTVYIKNSNTSAGTNNSVVFVRGANVVGTIQTTLTTTAYNTSSDYRLKKDIAPMVGSLAKVSQLKPVTYKWKLDGSDAEGFIAHELAEVCPHAVSGEKDAVDADGNPKYQGIDTSFLVATLTSAIQELSTLITAQSATIQSLTDRITALENK